MFLIQPFKCDDKGVWLFACILKSMLLFADVRLYSFLLHCSSAQLDSENQRCPRSHRGKCFLGVPCEREAKALVPLAEGRGATAAPGRHCCSGSHCAYFITFGAEMEVMAVF